MYVLFCILYTLSNVIATRIFTELGGHFEFTTLPNQSTKWDRFVTEKSHAAVLLARKLMQVRALLFLLRHLDLFLFLHHGLDDHHYR
jgi:hypothetical protein